MKSIAAILLALFSLLVTGCAEKNEEQKLASLRSSVLSASYQFTSDNAIKLAVTRYKDSRINEKTAHGMLGLLWLVKNKPQLACLEADAFSKLNKGRPDNLSLAIRTVAFHKMNWAELSAKEYAKLKANLEGEKNSAVDNTEDHKMASMGLVLVGLNMRDDAVSIKSEKALNLFSDRDNMNPLLEYAKTKANMAEEKNSAENTQDHKMGLIGQVLVGLNMRDDAIAIESAKALDALGSGENMKLLVDIAIKARDGNIEPAKQKLEQLRKRPGLSEQKKAMLDNFYNILMQQKPGKISPENVQHLLDMLANSVVTDIFKGSKLGAIINRL